jgi:hypothetical protein
MNWLIVIMGCWSTGWFPLFWANDGGEYFYRCYNGFYNGVVWYQKLELTPY